MEENKITNAYSNYCREHSDLKVVFNDFKAGFLAKENIIKESLKTLEDLRDNINNSPPLEQMLKSRDLDRINNKIEILNSLL